MSCHLCIRQKTGYRWYYLEGHNFKICERFMMNDLFQEFLYIVSCFDAPFHPRIFGWLLDNYVKVKYQAADRISDIFNPSKSFHSQRTERMINWAYENVQYKRNELNDYRWKDESFSLKIIFIDLKKRLKIIWWN